MNTLSVLVNGRHVDTYNHQGKTFIEGRKGSQYAIKYRNNSRNRVKIVVSVDGLNVVSGDKNWERGYVVEPFGSITVPGWRKDSDNVAQFEFSSIKSSYNQHNDSGDAANIGVIGCRVHVEKPQLYTSNWIFYNPPINYHHHYNYPYNWTTTVGYNGGNGSGDIGSINNTLDDGHTVLNCSYTMDCAPIAQACAEASPLRSVPQNSVGTGWGENKTFETKTVNYEFYETPRETLLIYYDDRRGLERRGIRLADRQTYQHEPNAFPDGCPFPK